MNLRDAVLLVRDTIKEELNKDSDGRQQKLYRQALDLYPATMAVAHCLWAKELSKGM